MNGALNDVRKAEHRSLRAEGDDSLEGTRWLWFVVQARDQAALSHSGEFRDPGADSAIGYQLHGSRS